MTCTSFHELKMFFDEYDKSVIFSKYNVLQSEGAVLPWTPEDSKWCEIDVPKFLFHAEVREEFKRIAARQVPHIVCR
jgi:hypothetical protein